MYLLIQSKKMHKFIITLILFSFTKNGFSQTKTWVNDVMTSNNNIHETIESFDEFWYNKEIEKGKGWKPFKRWQSFVETRTNSDGIFPSHMLYQEWDKIRYQQRSSASIQANWNPFGPIDVPLQSNGNKRGIGRVNVIEFDPNNPNILWAGAPAGGLWKSTDGGLNWSSNTDLLPNLGVSDIAIDPVNTNIMYIITGDRDAGDTYAYGVMKSIDGGESWNPTGLSFQLNYAYRGNRILINPNNTNILIASTRKSGYGETYRSTDGGENWTQVSEGPNFVSMEFHPNNPNIIYAATTGSSKFYKSTDNGISWTNMSLNAGLPNSGMNRGLIGVTPDNPDVVYILFSANDDGYGGLYKSTNQGISFELQSDNEDGETNLLGWSANASDEGGQGWYDLALAISPNNENLVFVGGVNCWKSENGGQDWSLSSHWTGAQNSSYVHADQHMLRYNQNTGTLYSANDGGLYYSPNDGDQWTDISDGLQISQFYKIGISQTNPNLLLAGAQDNGTLLATNPENWDAVLGGDGMECAIDPTDSDIMYAELYYGDISKSENGGNNWNNIAPDSDGAWITPYKIDQNNPNRIVIGYDFLYESLDYGETWENISIDFLSNLNVVALSPSDQNTIYTSTGNDMYKTNDGGDNWQSISASLPNRDITDIEVHPENKDRIWITLTGFGDGDKVFYSNNGGENWTNISENLPNLPANCITYYSTDETLFLGTDIGVWYIDSTTNQWTSFNQGMPNVIVNELEINYQANLLFAATYGRGVWTTELPYNIAPVASFNPNIVSECIGSIQIENLSTFYDSVMWNFGDGSTSNSPNPNHNYSSDGTYDITLIAYNSIGSDTLTQSITLDITEPPSLESLYSCLPSTFEFTAVANDENSIVSWYSDPQGLNLINEGENFTTQELNVTATFYLKESKLGSVFNDGPTDQNSLGNGGFHENAEWQQVFSSTDNTILKSVYLYAEESFSIDIVLKLSDGTTIESQTVNVVAGGNTVNLDFNIPIAQNMTLGIEGENLGLWRNNEVTDYPISVGNNITITESTAGDEYFYYFYNWEVQEYCSSSLVEVEATVGSLESLEIDIDNECLYNELTLTANGNFESFTWQDQSQSQNLTIQEPGTYSVTGIDTDGCSKTESIVIPSINTFSINTGNQTYCEGSSIFLQTPSGLDSYLWNTGETSNVIEVNSDNTYTITAIDQNNCEYNDEIEIIFNPVDPIAINSQDGTNICRGDEFTLTASGGQNYVWNNVYMGEAYTLSSNMLGSQTYFVTSVDENNCYSTDSIEIQIIDCSSIEELDKNSIILFPNPNDGDFTIFHKSQGDKIKTIRIFDTRNRLIESRNIRYIDNQISEKFNVKGISKGIYFVEMIGKVDNYYQKIIVN